MKFKDHKKKELELKHQIAKRKRLWARYVMWMTAAAVLFIVVFAGTFIAPIVLALMGIISPEAAGFAFLGAFLSLFAGAFVA